MKRIQTRVGSDLTKYTENFFFGMSLRQTLLSAAGVALTAGVYIFLPVPGILAACCGVPLFALAFLKPDGLSAEKWLWYWLRANVLRPRVRTYTQQSPLYDFLWNGRLLGRKILGRRELARLAGQGTEETVNKKNDLPEQKGDRNRKRNQKNPAAAHAARAGRARHQRRP